MRFAAILARFRQWFPLKQLAIFEACLIGLASALSAGLMAQGVDSLGRWRIQLSHQWPALVVLPLFGLVGALLSGWLIEREAPEASGSGMSQVKAVLANVPMPLNLRVALVKLVSAILALGSGLALGREGPTVQVGASLAAQLNRWIPTSPDYRRQLIASAAGAGLAAAFNAPIAGVLLVAEQLLQDVSGATLGTAILASFIGSSVSRLLGGNSLDVNLDLQGPRASFMVGEMPLFLILGVLAGGLGALFNHGILASLKLNQRYLWLSLPWRMAIAGLISGVVIALMPELFRDHASLRELLLSGDTDWRFAAIAFVAQFFLILLAYGSGAPGGLLVPTLLLGASLGYCLGAFQQHFWNIGLPTTYARVGMGAFMGATAKAPITAIVIVFEMTRDFNLVLPLMIGSVTAFLVAERCFAGSFYDRTLELSGIQLPQETAPSRLLVELQAKEVMQRRVETLSSQLTLDQVMQAFSRSHHRGFPVVDQNGLVGIVTQTDLGKANQQQLPGNTPLAALMTPNPITVSPADSLSDVLYLLNRYRISRLPVVDGRKLIGIITRSDIIRIEADHLSGEGEPLGPRAEPSYVVYRVQSPATGKGRILLPLANPETADTLLQLAFALARDRHYEIECLHVIPIPRHRAPAATAVKTVNHRRLLQRAERQGRQVHVPVHTQIRVAHDVAQTILEVIKERHINLVLMGWEGSTSSPGRVFGNVADTVIRQAASDVVLVKLAAHLTAGFTPEAWNRWLVPIAGGPNSRYALQLIPALISLSQSPEIRLCQVYNPEAAKPDFSTLEQEVDFLRSRVQGMVSATAIRSRSVAPAIVELARAEQDDVIMVGASRESLLTQAIQGNIPEAIADASDCTVILVRSEEPLS